MQLLTKYCKEHKTSIAELARMIGLTQRQLYAINKDPDIDPHISTVLKLAKVTEKNFGEPLLPWNYLNVPGMQKLFRKRVSSKKKVVGNRRKRNQQQ